MLSGSTRSPIGLRLFSVMLAAASAGLVLHASYPGYLNPDTFWQLKQIEEGHYNDWHSPFMTFVWSLAHRLLPGPGGFITLDNALIWAALATITVGAARKAGPWALLVLTVPWLPGVFNYLGHVHKDVMLSAWLLAGFACAFCANDPGADPRARRIWQILSNLLALAAFLTRSNAVFALIPLLVYANLRLGWRRSSVAALLVMALMPAAQTVQNRLLNVESTHPADSIKTFHLLALSYVEGRNLFPGRWTGDDSRTIVNACYSPVQWDTAARWGQCSGIHRNLERQGIWGNRQLTEAWIRALLSNPLAAYSVMAATFERSMHDPNSRAMLFEQPASETIQFPFSTPPRKTTELARAYIESEFNDRLGRPWVFSVVLALSLAWLFALRVEATRFGLLSCALIASGSIYLLTYFPLNVSAEFRYFHWTGFAAYLGFVSAALACIVRLRVQAVPDGSDRPLPGPIRLGLCATLALMISLVFGATHLPQETRTVQLTPMGDGTIIIMQLRTASVPQWMAPDIQGEVVASGWARGAGPGLRSGDDARPLISRIETLHHTIRLRFLAGPDGGRVLLQDGAYSRVVNTQAPRTGELVVELPPNGPLAAQRRHASWHGPARALLWTLLLTPLLFFVGRPVSTRLRVRSAS